MDSHHKGPENFDGFFVVSLDKLNERLSGRWNETPSHQRDVPLMGRCQLGQLFQKFIGKEQQNKI